MLIIHILIINDCTTTKNNAGDKTHNGHYNSNSNNNNTYIYTRMEPTYKNIWVTNLGMFTNPHGFNIYFSQAMT